MNKFVVEQNRIRQGALAILTSYLVLMSLYIAYASLSPTYMGARTFALIFGVICALFFGYALLHVIKGLFSVKDILEIDKKGINDNTGIFSIGYMPWEDVETFYLRRLFVNEVICVKLINYKEHMARMPFLKRLAIKLNTRMGASTIAINLQGAKCSSKQAFENMKKLCPTDKAGSPQSIYSSLFPTMEEKK